MCEVKIIVVKVVHHQHLIDVIAEDKAVVVRLGGKRIVQPGTQEHLLSVVVETLVFGIGRSQCVFNLYTPAECVIFILLFCKRAVQLVPTGKDYCCLKTQGQIIYFI